MDKFGIFDLLDTLAQIASSTDDTEKPQDAPQEPPPARRASPDDKSFLPPDFGDKTAPANEQKTGRSALNSLYERHESISKRIDKKK